MSKPASIPMVMAICPDFRPVISSLTMNIEAHVGQIAFAPAAPMRAKHAFLEHARHGRDIRARHRPHGRAAHVGERRVGVVGLELATPDRGRCHRRSRRRTRTGEPANLPSMPRADLGSSQGEGDAGRGVAPVRNAAVRRCRQEAAELRARGAVAGQDLPVEQIGDGHAQVGAQRLLKTGQNGLIFAAENVGALQAGRRDCVRGDARIRRVALGCILRQN